MIPVSKPYIGDEEKQAVLEVLESGMLVQGPKVAALEAEFARVHGVKHAVAANSGTAALHLALLAHGVGPGDEVITVSFTFIATVNTILFCGARPVFVDVDPVTFNIDVNQIEAAITPRTKAILLVHLYGLPADMGAIMALAERHGLAVIEDACQAVAATYHERPVGSFGTGMFSLYATKNVMTAEGGMVTTNDDTIADKVRLMRQHGMRKRYQYEMLGYNYRMSDLHAAIGLAQMTRLEAWTQARRANAAFLNAKIESVITPTTPAGYGHVWHQYTVRLDGRDREAVIASLAAAGVGSVIFYPTPAHLEPHVRAVAGDIRLPVTEQLAADVLSLPVHPQLSQAELETIVAAVNAV